MFSWEEFQFRSIQGTGLPLNGSITYALLDVSFLAGDQKAIRARFNIENKFGSKERVLLLFQTATSPLASVINIRRFRQFDLCGEGIWMCWGRSHSSHVPFRSILCPLWLTGCLARTAGHRSSCLSSNGDRYKLDWGIWPHEQFLSHESAECREPSPAANSCQL